MAIEVEVKLRVGEPEPLTRRLDAYAGFVRRYRKTDRYYGRSGGGYPEFRLRDDGDHWTCTVKERNPRDGFEHNIETEFSIDDAVAFDRFAAALGYTVLIEKRKQGREYRNGDIVIELSEVATLGWFLEIECLIDEASDRSERSAAEARIRTVMDDLALSRDAIETRPYTQMLYDVDSTAV